MPGDGIGPEQTKAVMRVLEAVEGETGVSLDVKMVEGGDGCLKRRGVPLPDETVETIERSHACLKGPVGETAADVIVKLRIAFDLYANVRPAKAYPNVPCLRPDIDLVIVRENTEDLYKGYEFKVQDGAIALRVITRKGCERIIEYAFKLAMERRKRVTAVHKANVLKVTCGLFAEVCRDVAKRYPQVEFEEMYVDAAAMNLIRKPQHFDVIVTTNLFGDILSDEAAQVVGGLGMAPAANIGEKLAIFEPVHGCAPDIAGRGIANPYSMILSAGMMFNWLGKLHEDQSCLKASKLIEEAVKRALKEGALTKDLGGKAKTEEVGEKVALMVGMVKAGDQ
jgi:3-isopropylmalate dehydrogenase